MSYSQYRTLNLLEIKKGTSKKATTMLLSFQFIVQIIK